MPNLDPNIGLVLLAAGRGSRFGRDKLNERFRDRPLWTWAAEAAEIAGFAQKYIVRAKPAASGLRDGWIEVINSAATRGMGTSIAAGVEAAQNCSRIIVALADMPLVEPAHLARLALESGTVFTCYGDGKSGCPAAFPQEVFTQLRSLAGNAGAKSLPLADVSIIRPANPSSLTDVDTPQDLAGISS